MSIALFYICVMYVNKSAVYLIISKIMHLFIEIQVYLMQPQYIISLRLLFKLLISQQVLQKYPIFNSISF